MRFRPRFTVRTLAIFVTLVCAYFGAWEPTRKYGVTKQGFVINQRPINPFNKLAARNAPYWVCVYRVNSPMPLILTYDLFDDGGQDSVSFGPRFSKPRFFYLWLFGPKIKLPFDSTWKWGTSPHARRYGD